jgi:hypothetical protein
MGGIFPSAGSTTSDVCRKVWEPRQSVAPRYPAPVAPRRSDHLGFFFLITSSGQSTPPGLRTLGYHGDAAGAIAGHSPEIRIAPQCLAGRPSRAVDFGLVVAWSLRSSHRRRPKTTAIAQSARDIAWSCSSGATRGRPEAALQSGASLQSTFWLLASRPRSYCTVISRSVPSSRGSASRSASPGPAG